jgi:hypothetical protein
VLPAWIILLLLVVAVVVVRLMTVVVAGEPEAIEQALRYRFLQDKHIRLPLVLVAQ